MPIIETMEIVVVAVGLLVLLTVPAVFGFIDERRARAAAVLASGPAIGTVERAIEQAPVANPVAADVPDDRAHRGGDPGTEAVGVLPGPPDPADT